MKVSINELAKKLDKDNLKASNELFAKLKETLGNNDKTDIDLTVKEKVILLKTRTALESDWNYEYPFEWRCIVVNTNWLSLVMGRTVVCTPEYYKKTNPNNEPINS
jgi:hypothetical protein